ncbi:hypothetical protein B7P43_G06695 [Cryptotermes secundus]|uniref:Uncharacterized protein n=1 Tax=Cryptotermes secundus TaxID=105785 RepID=A0A2J7Q3J6_9NEOP|nr:hypothetical protein B7P43_G06695 [Cryptotermes secundus]
MKAWREEMATTKDNRMNAWQEETTACQDETEKNPGEKADVVDRQSIPNKDNEMLACQEMEAHLVEENSAPVDMKPPAAQQKEVPIVIPVGETMACRETEAHSEEDHVEFHE